MSSTTPAVAYPSSRGLALKVRLTTKSRFRRATSGTAIGFGLSAGRYRASSDRVDGICESNEGPAIAARVRAVPANGEANAALERLIANWLDVPKSCVALTAGQKSRIKTVTISGEPGAILQRLADRLTQPPSKKTKP